MNNSILVVYKSATGFTKRYAEMIAKELKCKILAFDHISLDIINEYDTVIFGSRIYAGHIDDITRMIKLIEASHINHFVIFVTGASPTEDHNVQAAFENSLSKTQLKKYPHYYFPGGLNYKEMSFMDKSMLKGLKFYLKSKKKKSEDEKDLLERLNHSFDMSDKKYIQNLLNDLKI